MANCPNCGAKLSCGCQRKTASDGKQGCVQCIPAYEAKMREQKNKEQGRKNGEGALGGSGWVTAKDAK